MHGHFPYLMAAAMTAASGGIATFVRAAQAPVHPAVVLAPSPGMARVVTPAFRAVNPGVSSMPVLPGNAVNTPAQTPVAPGQAFLTPGFGPAQQVGTGGVPGVPSFTEGFGTTSAFSATNMNQPGREPFPEGLYGNQGFSTSMDQPGQPDYYDGFAFNRGVVPPNQGAQPLTPYPNYTIAPASPAVAPQNQSPLNAPGFNNGFGGGQPDFGFYAGFTTPR